MDINYTNTTRYLCAAAYLDKVFRHRIIEEIYRKKHRAIAVSLGVDAPTVVKYCLIAQRRNNIRNIVLTILFILTVKNLLSLDLLVLFLLLILSYLIILGDKIYIFYNIPKNFSQNNFRPEPQAFNANYEIQERLKEIATEQNGNVIVYGDFNPFVGSGTILNAWSFALNLDIGKQELVETLQPIPFSVEELYEYVTNSIQNLNFTELSIHDKLCVDGSKIRDNRLFLPDIYSRPFSYIDPQNVKNFVNSAKESVRYYKHVKVISWSGELVLSIFFRFYIVNNKLFVEACFYVLFPLKSDYKTCDAIEPILTVSRILKLSRVSLKESFTDFILLPLQWPRFFQAWQGNKRRQKEIRNIIKENRNFNYGAITSIRELASSSSYSKYFQKLDREMYIKIIERQIIQALTKFLDNKNIDTSELENRANVILNSGLIVSNSEVHAANIAVGENAKSSIN